MGETKKWIKNLFVGKKQEEKKASGQVYSLSEPSKTFTRSGSVHKQKPLLESSKKERGWIFRRSPHRVPTVPPVNHAVQEPWIEKKKVVAVGVRLRRRRSIEETAAVIIQSGFRCYLARKALKALKGLVKVQALVRGYLVRKRTTAILHGMQSIAIAQARARCQRIGMSDEPDESNSSYLTQPNHRKSGDRRSRQSNYQERDWRIQGSIKIVEMDVGESNRSTNRKKTNSSKTNHRSLKGSLTIRAKQERQDLSMIPRALSDSSTRAPSSPKYSTTARSSPNHSSTASMARSSPRYSSTASKPDHPSQPQAFQRVFTNRAFSKQERQDLLLSPQPSGLVGSSSPTGAEYGLFDDYYLDTAQSSPHASSRASKPECPSFDFDMTPPVKVERPRSAPGKSKTEANPVPKSPIRWKAPQAPRPNSNVGPSRAKVAMVGELGEKRDYGTSPSRTGHTSIVRDYGRCSPSRTGHTNTVRNYGSSPSHSSHTNTIRGYGTSPSRTGPSITNYGSSPSRTGHTNNINGISRGTWK